MKVFLSWSGDLSGSLGAVLNDWLPTVLQPVEPFYSTEMDKGAQWFGTIMDELNTTKIGVVCLTPDNVGAPWIMFEAGAIAKQVTHRTLACAILFGLDKAQVTGPLAQLQLTEFEKEYMKRLVRTINSNLGDRALDQQRLERTFDKCWPDLANRVETAVEAVRSKTSIGKQPKRDTRDMVEEILDLTRSLAARPSAAPSQILSSTPSAAAFRNITTRTYPAVSEFERSLALLIGDRLNRASGRPLPLDEEGVLSLADDLGARVTRVRDGIARLSQTGYLDTARSEGQSFPHVIGVDSDPP